MLFSCLAREKDSERPLQDFQTQLKDEFKALTINQAGDQSDKKQHLQLSLMSERICPLIFYFVRHSVNDKNPMLLAKTLKLILILLDKSQLFVDGNNKISSSVLFKFNSENQGQLNQFSTVQQKTELSADLKWLFGKLYELLPRILPARSGFSRQAIDFLDSKRLCIEWGCFKFDHLRDYHFFFEVAGQQSTALTAHSVVCAVSDSEDVGHIFDHVWVAFGPDRLLGYARHFLQKQVIPKVKDENSTNRIERMMWTSFLFWGLILLFCIGLPSVLALLVLYPASLTYVFLVHGFGVFEEIAESIADPTVPDQSACGRESSGEISPREESHHDVSGKTQDSNKILELLVSLFKQYFKSISKIIKNAIERPVVLFQAALVGNQSVSRHMLCLPGMGSLKMLQALVDAPIDVFEAPVVRAAVEGMWSRFRFGFYARFALYAIQLLLFSAFACWSIATNANYSELGKHEDGVVRASFVGGCVAAGIGSYFLTRELLQCFSCLVDGGLKDYIEFWNVVQVCSHTLELTSFGMFVSGSDPISTRLVATYAIFFLWIGLLYFTKAIRQISFLIEILTTIVSDMVPFIFIMMVLIMAVTMALQVLTADLKSKAESNNENATFSPEDAQSMASFGMLFSFAMRAAEGRQDLAGSALEHLARAVYEQPDFWPSAMDAFVYTIYLCFYFLALVITVVALNALIALMGSSYERVMEKKISQR
jgi:hypothetical protein